MDHQTGAKLRFEPRRLRRHNITRIGDIHQLLHRNGIQSQGNLHLTAIHTAFQFTSRIKFEEIVTSNTPIGSLSSYVPGLAVKEYHFPPKYREKLCKAPGL